MQDFKEAKDKRIANLPVWWLNLTHEKTGQAWEISGDVIARRNELSFSKSPHSPRFPTPPFARVHHQKESQK